MKVNQFLESTDVLRYGDRVVLKKCGSKGIIKHATSDSTFVDVLLDGKKKPIKINIGTLERE